MADDDNKPAQTLTLDEEAPQTLQLDQPVEGGETPKPTYATKFEAERAPENREGFLGAVGNELSGIMSSGPVSAAVRHAQQVPGWKGKVLGLADLALSPMQVAPYQVEGQLGAIENAKKRAAEGRSLPYQALADTAELTGIASPRPMEEAANRGDTGGVLGHAATQATLAATPVISEGLGRIGDKITRGTPMTEAGRIEAAKQQALTVKKPSMNETEYANQVSQALPDLQKIAQDNKGKIKTPRQAVRGINARISEIEQPIREHLENLPPTEVVHPDQYLPEVQKAVDDALKAKSGSYTPKEIEKAKQTVNEFLGDGVKRPIEIERNRMRLNQDADAYFHADTAGKRAIDVSDATAIAQRAAANKIRDILYGDAERPGALENFGVSATDATGKQVPIRDVRKQVGNLINVRDHFEDAITRAEATGDWSPFEKWRSGPSLAAGGLGVLGGGAVGGPVGAVFGALAGEGVKAWADYLRSKNPNLNTEKMFRNLADTSAPNVSQIQTRAPVRAFQAPIGPAVPEGGLPPIEPAQRPLGFAPSPEEAPLFSIPQSPRAPRPDFEEPRLAPIQGEQQPLNLPPESAPLFNIQTPNPLGRVGEAPKVSPTPAAPATPAELPPIGGPGREGVLGKIGETKSVAPAPVEKVRIPHPEAVDLKPGEATSDRFYNKETDEWTPEREANHDAVADAAIKDKTPPTDRPPEAIITMGGTASGKTTLTRQILGADTNRVNIDSDTNKLSIPEYEGLKDSDPDNAAARVHEESKAISRRTIQKAVQKGLDFIYDTSTGGGGEKLFKKLKDLGYNVRVVYADVPVEEAIKRAEERAKSSEDPSNRDRIVPEDVIRQKHTEAAKAFNELRNSPNVDEVRAFDTTSRTPEEFYNRKGKSETVHNQKTLDRINEKANGKATVAK